MPKKSCHLIAMDLSKQQTLNTDPKTTQQINFTGNLDLAGKTVRVFSIVEVKESVLLFFKRNCESIVNTFRKFILVLIENEAISGC